MRTLYQCDICGRSSADREEIAACEARGIEKRSDLAVGDIVTARAGFGWFDGDKRWVSNPRVLNGGREQRRREHGNCFGACCTYQFYYVVTAIEAEGHRTRYHLATKAMTPATGYHAGWTSDDGSHFTPVRVTRTGRPLDTADLLGLKAESLL